MLSSIVFVFFFLGLSSTAPSPSCRWMTHKYSEYSEASFILLDSMAKNSTNITEDAEAVPFPEDLYTQVSKASAEHRMSFIAQILEEVALLFEKDHSSASWDEKTLEDFLGVIHQQAENLRACVGSNHKSKKLQMFFKGLSKRVLERMGHSADAWELIRREVKIHLFQAAKLTLQ